METIGFVGPSGTGKSFRAMYVARKNKIEYIIDDGLFINALGVVAGVSAKKEPTKIASVRRALFNEPEHAAQVKQAIARSRPKAILILGTSDRMVEKITDALGLPHVARIIHIDEISTPEEMARAKKIRTEQGKHVIPVPTFAIKKDFSGYFMDTLKVFMMSGKNHDFLAEKTIVRPTFSYLGEYHISNQVIINICAHETKQVADVARLLKVAVHGSEDGVTIELDTVLAFGRPIPDISGEVFRRVVHGVEELTSILVEKITLNVKGLEFEPCLNE